MTQRWLLIETFGGGGHAEPTVIGVGSTPKRMVALATILGRGRYLDDVRALVARVLAAAEPVHTTSSDGQRQLIGHPLIAFSGNVHGVYAWVGPVGEGPPPRDPAGAWHFNLTTGKIAGSNDLLDLYGVPHELRQTERVIAEAFGRLITNADESAALAVIVQARPGSEHQATWSVRRDDGAIRAANFATRAVLEVAADGAEHVVLRGITHDIGPAETTPSAPPRMVLAEQVLAAQQEPGRHRAIVNLRTLSLLRWIDEPMPGVAWEHHPQHPPAIHPEDLRLARVMSARLATEGRAGDVLRLRGQDGEWLAVAVSANLMLLDQHTTAALVTLSAPDPEAG